MVTRSLVALLLAVAAITACGGRSPPATTAAAPPTLRTPPSAAASEAGAPALPLTEAECHRLLDHVLALVLAAELETGTAAGRGEPELPTATDRDAMAEGYRRAHLESCLAMPRPRYQCAMDTHHAAELEGC